MRLAFFIWAPSFFLYVASACSCIIATVVVHLASFLMGHTLAVVVSATVARFDLVEMALGCCFFFMTVFQSVVAFWVCSAYVREVVVACEAVAGAAVGAR